MHNPQSLPQLIPAKTMYSYRVHSNIPWNMAQYQTPLFQCDAKRNIQQRVYASQKKGVKVNDFYVTRRGFYMDYDLKVAKGIPSSCVHIDQNPWDGTKTVLQGDAFKAARQASKRTIYDQMQRKQSMHPVPGISTYKLEKSLSQLQQIREKINAKKIQHDNKRYFHENTSFLSDQCPGAGQYNPHEQVQKIHLNRQNWKSVSQKHQKLNKILTKRLAKIPAPATYKPISQQFKSFASIQKQSSKQKMIKNGFGSDARFAYVRPKKRVIVQKRPSPNSYQTKIQWKDKSVSPKKKEWYKMVWKGSSSSVYH